MSWRSWRSETTKPQSATLVLGTCSESNRDNKAKLSDRKTLKTWFIQCVTKVHFLDMWIINICYIYNSASLFFNPSTLDVWFYESLTRFTCKSNWCFSLTQWAASKKAIGLKRRWEHLGKETHFGTFYMTFLEVFCTAYLSDNLHSSSVQLGWG